MDFAEWMRNARPGEQMVYFVGDLAYSRWERDEGKVKPDATTLAALAEADAAYAAYSAGKVRLTQGVTKEQYRKFLYIATKRSRASA